MKVYLAGFINGKKIRQCAEWRKQIRDFYADYKGARYPVDFLDPLNMEDLGRIDKEGLTSSIPRNAIVHKDYMSVRAADMIIANLDTFGEKRPCIGTFCECAWAYEFRKPLILITNNKSYSEHPFLSYFASYIVKDVKELLAKKIINKMYKSMVSAEY
jgi:nucleoside 2-deoxyribosyltransferase